MSWPHLQLGCEIVRGAAFTPLQRRQTNITLKRAEARAPSAATVLIKIEPLSSTQKGKLSSPPKTSADSGRGQYANPRD